MKISVIVPVWNVEKYLSKCINSLVNQTLKEIEIILINDGSTDNSLKIMEEYAKKYKNIIVINQKNSGQGIARNKGIEMAKGEYISFVDSDDFIDKNMLKEMYDKAKKEKADICICEQKQVNENYEEIEIEHLDIIGDYGTCQSNSSILFTNMGPCNKIFKKSLLEEEKILFPTKRKLWYEDFPFVATALITAKKICWINKAYYSYLQRANSTMNNSNIEKNLDIIEAFKILKNNLASKVEINKYHEELEFLCLDHVYLFTSVRVIKTNNKMKDKKIVLNEIEKYIKKDYPKFKKNKYIKNISKKRQIIFSLLNYHLYSIIYVIFKLKNKTKDV